MDQTTVVTAIYAVLGTGGITGAMRVFSNITKAEKTAKQDRDAMASRLLSLEAKMEKLDPERLSRVDIRMADMSSQVAQSKRFAEEDRTEMRRQIDRLTEAIGTVGDMVQQLKSQKWLRQ